MLEWFWDQILNSRIEFVKVTENFFDPTEKSIVITKKLFNAMHAYLGNGLY